MKKNKLRAIKPLLRQVLFLKRIEAEMQAAYELISSRLVEELASHIKTIEPLSKSDEKDLNEMVKKVPRFEVDLSSINKLIEKYMLALKYTIIGKAAGKEAEDAVAELRLKTKIPAGGVVQGYLSALDAHTEYLKDVLDKEGNISSKWTKYGLDFIKEKTGMMVDSKILELRSRTLTALQDSLKELDVQNEAAVREYVLAEQFADRNIKTIKAKQALVKEAIQDVFEKKTPLHVIKQRLKDVTKDYATNWNLIIRTETGLASGAASQQAIQDIVGHEDPVVAIIVVKDDRLSEFCNDNSLNEDRSYKYFKMSSLKPPGFNLGKKKGEWKNSIPSRHFRCRCSLVYIPDGFRLDQYGSLIALKEGDTLTLES